MYDNPETATALKKLFAASWLRQPDNPFAAAREIEPDAPGRQYYISTHWIEDPIVIAEKERLVSLYGPIARVPTKEELALEIYKKECKDDAQKLQYLKFFAQLMGYTDDENSAKRINNNIMVGVRIMPVPLAASDEEWEAKAREHAIVLQSRHG